MSIDAYHNIQRVELNMPRTTSEGKVYTLNHPDELVLNMKYVGENKSSSNSQGWERSSSYYFSELREKHPEFFSKRNTIRIENGEAPKVDTRFVSFFPQYKGFENETLIHHHVGKDGQAVAVPQSIHKGSGEIHIIENRLGVTENAKQFSQLCKSLCDKDQALIGNTADYFKGGKATLKIMEDAGMDYHSSEEAMVRKRKMTPEMLQSRREDTEAVLENYRENLHSHGVTDEAAIDRFLKDERAKIEAEYESLDRGDTSPNMYMEPTDWGSTSASLGKANRSSNAFSSATNSPEGEGYEASSHENAFSKATSPSESANLEKSSRDISFGNTAGENTFHSSTQESHGHS